MRSPENTRYLIKEMNRYYERRAPWHDYYMGYESNESMEKLLYPIIEVLEPIVSGRRVLEIACGTGNWTGVLAGRASFVTATDISPTAIRIAQKKSASLRNVAFEVADAYSLGGLSGAFDMAFAADWWSHMPREVIPSFLRTVIGKLMPDSHVVFIEMSMRDSFRKEACFYDKEGNRINLRQLPDGSEFQVIRNFPDEAELRSHINPFGENIIYREFDTLKRWMVMFNAVRRDI
jgi:2-polyprenyl-3-methyl-5-hydroxy-6-metoxy-1,4-benzoquinol methylase